jgi:DNA repair exonuclease SbcCD ATPase subunit
VIRLRRLRLRSFRSFYDEATIDFPESGLLLIKGASQDHGDSSGSGKSSILLAIAYALGICDQPATELQSWGATKPMQVELTLADDGLPSFEVTIYRGKKNAVEYTGGNTVTGAKAIDAELRQLLGLSPEILRAISFRAQNSRGSFLAMTDAEKKEFLTGLLGLKQIETALEESEKMASAYRTQVDYNERELESCRVRLSQIPGPMALSDTSFLESEVERLKKEVLDAENDKIHFSSLPPDPEIVRLHTLRELIQGKLSELRARERQQDQDLWKAKEVAHRKLEGIEHARREFDKAWQLLDGLEVGRCPTCGGVWEDHQAKVKAQYQLEAARTEVEQSSKDLESCQATLAQQMVPVTGIDMLTDNLREVQNALDEAVRNNAADAKLPVVEAKLAGLRAQLRTATGALGLARDANARAERQNEAVRVQRGQTEIIMERAGAAATDNQLKLNAELDFELSLGRKGFLGIIFGDVLQEIKAEANSKLAQLANVSQVTLDLVTETETKAGTAKKAITPVFYVNGNETRFSSLSGGMQTSVDLVVDLALMTVVQRRTGAMPGFLFLDEAFNGQGVVTKEASLDALRVYAQEKLIIVIDHSSETKEFFSQVLEVENSGGKSSIASLG